MPNEVKDLAIQRSRGKAFQAEEIANAKALSYSMGGISLFCPEFVHTCLTTLSLFTLFCGHF